MKRINKNSIVTSLAVSFVLGLMGPMVALAATAPSLGTTTTFALVSSTWTNTLNAGLETAINGDVCYTTPPGTPPVSINGVTVAPLSQAVVPCTNGGVQATALAALNSQSCTSLGTNVTLNAITIGSNPPGTFPPGCYSSSGSMDITLSTTVTLDATAPGGDGGNVWIFRSGGALTTGANSLVALAHGASATNVFWTPSGTASLGANAATSLTATFVGNIIEDSLGSTGINLGHFANLLGRALAFGHTVTTDSNTITVPSAPPPPPPAVATLHIIKQVFNVSSMATPPNFLVHVKSATSTFDVSGSPLAGTSTPGTLYTLPAGTYAVSEDSNLSFPTYQQTFGLDCVGGIVILAPGDNQTCTIINTDIPPVPVVVSSSGGGSPSLLPLITVTKVPSPLALPQGPGLVTYTYTVTNIGPTPMINVWVKDDHCAPVTFVSGDTNNNATLEANEAWIYRCTKTVSQTETNTATAHGWYNGWDVNDIANATVVVGVPRLPNTGILPPLIHVTKIPTPPSLFAGGGMVGYTEIVSNPGVVPLSNVRLSDDKCAPLQYISGDTNGDAKLDPSETWVYICRTTLNKTTINTVMASGDANAMTAEDFAIATVVVASPSLPNTGYRPMAMGNPMAVNISNSSNGISRAEVSATFSRSLSIGASGADVVALQTALMQKGFLTMPSGVSKGYFGALTSAAVTSYQVSVGLPQVGIFGPMTRAQLLSELGQ